MAYVFYPQGVCSRKMEFELDDQGVITQMQVEGGCSGNLQGLRMLVLGQRAEDVVARLDGIHCGEKSTSCPDQFAKALTLALTRKSAASISK